MRIKPLHITIVFFLLIMAACFSRQKLSRHNLAFLYNEEKIYLKPDVNIFHKCDDTTTLFFRINTDELLYARIFETDSIYNSFSISYTLFEAYESKSIKDSASFHFSDTVKQRKTHYISDSIDIAIATGQDYIIKFKARDNNRNKDFISFYNIKKKNALSGQRFRLYNDAGEMLFTKHFNKEEALTLYYRGIPDVDRIFVKRYHRTFPIATPPFHTTLSRPKTITPDTIYSLNLKNGLSEPIILDREGIYRVQADTASHYGTSFSRFHEGFPAITSPEQMLLSARYLTTRKEFENMIIRANKKEAIEEFWLNIGGNKDRARQLIQTYYARVRAANKFFTSYHEGWKTDRGMIYIIYGPPATVYKDSHTENWIYGEATSIRAVNFLFYKVENPLTDNDFMLSKSEMARDSWYYAVSNWRR